MSCIQRALPPIDLRAICFVRAIRRWKNGGIDYSLCECGILGIMEGMKGLILGNGEVRGRNFGVV